MLIVRRVRVTQPTLLPINYTCIIINLPVDYLPLTDYKYIIFLTIGHAPLIQASKVLIFQHLAGHVIFLRLQGYLFASRIVIKIRILSSNIHPEA